MSWRGDCKRHNIGVILKSQVNYQLLYKITFSFVKMEFREQDASPSLPH